jgi:hypothetical protein
VRRRSGADGRGGAAGGGQAGNPHALGWVGGQPASQSVPKGTKGTIVSFTDEKTKAEFANASWLFKPEQLEKAIEDGVVSQASAV